MARSAAPISALSRVCSITVVPLATTAVTLKTTMASNSMTLMTSDWPRLLVPPLFPTPVSSRLWSRSPFMYHVLLSPHLARTPVLGAIRHCRRTRTPRGERVTYVRACAITVSWSLRASRSCRCSDCCRLLGWCRQSTLYWRTHHQQKSPLGS
jgi:hypothetical protein